MCGERQGEAAIEEQDQAPQSAPKPRTEGSSLHAPRANAGHVDKLALLGELLPGIVHDVHTPNQLLKLNIPFLRAVWQEALEVLREHAGTDPDFRIANMPIDEIAVEVDDVLRELIDGSTRIENMTAHLGDFARRETERTPYDVNQGVRRALDIIAFPLRKRLVISRIELAKDIPMPIGMPGRFEHALAALLLELVAPESGRDPSIRIATSYEPRSDEVRVLVERIDLGLSSDFAREWKRISSQPRRAADGTGTGVSSPRDLADAIGATMDFEESVRGVQLRLRIPLRTA